VDLELQRFQRRYHRKLLRIGVCINANANANTDINANTGSCWRELRPAVGQCGCVLRNL
jgi:hypothetical protein